MAPRRPAAVGPEPAAGAPRDARCTRRTFVGAVAAGALAAALPACGRRREVEGGFALPSVERGHLLRDVRLAPPAPPREDAAVVVVGGGVAGLSAAWRLVRAGVDGVRLLELEDVLGGTAAGGARAGIPFPWGAHYVPRPTREQRALVRLLEEVGAVRGFDAQGRALADEAQLCRAPQERLCVDGVWHDGLMPAAATTAEDRRQWERFEAEVAALAARRDDAGRRAFAIPVAHSARDEDLLALDRTSMAAWLASHGYDAPFLRWTVEYACRDDYGADLAHTSAWAGLHYFASRVAVPGDEPAPFLTWPDGNGRLVRALAAAVGDVVRTGCVVLRAQETADRGVVTWLDVARGTVHETHAPHVVVAVPRHVARRVVPVLRDEPRAFVTSPWVVANVSLDATPASRGFPTAWDNVRLGSPSLGYVVATHQADRLDAATVWTWYRAYVEQEPETVRASLLSRSWASLRDEVLADLAPGHEDLERHVVAVDVARWGHAMVRPEPGFLWGGVREAAARPRGRLHFAAADLGGLPLFEEAQWAGVRAAEEVLAARGTPPAESWL